MSGSSDYIAQWAVAFLLTQVVEIGVYLQTPGLDRPRLERLAIGFGASAITHPLVWFVIPDLVYNHLDFESSRRAWWFMVVVAESWAWLGEAVWLRCFGVPWRVALGIALLANGASFVLGLFVMKAFGF